MGEPAGRLTYRRPVSGLMGMAFGTFPDALHPVACRRGFPITVAGAAFACARTSRLTLEPTGPRAPAARILRTAAAGCLLAEALAVGGRLCHARYDSRPFPDRTVRLPP
ncbi:hypothetical protein WQQ_18690 [Hydrocarboniphaga effusa AP103]|uniref:Uncharacterized protein n=1 Tax=Hydrocarboniphaga effusa AP103 TaxID=1172194 RepID=I7ZIZ5_9GAMM|nr:hypothetical protein WQQ_18690 [Hydrocarboniphaga effusa AP103]